MIMLATIAVFLMFILILQGELWSGTALNHGGGTVNYTEPQWSLQNDGGILDPAVKDSEPVPMTAGETYVMKTVLTYDGTRDQAPYAFLHADHMYCQVLLEGKELCAFRPEDLHKWDRSQSPGFFYQAFPLPKDCRGMELEIRMQPALQGVYSFRLPELLMGDYRSITKSMLTLDIPHNVATVLCMMMGISALLFSAASLTGSEYRQGFNIGAFALLVSLYFYTESRTNFYVLPNPYYLYFVRSLSMSLLPVSFMGVMREAMPGVQKQICTGVIVLEMAFFLTELFLHLTGRMDMAAFYPVLHLISLGEMLVNTVLFLSLKQKKRKTSMGLQLIPVVVGMILDLAVYRRGNPLSAQEGSFTTIGVVIFLLMQLVHTLVSQARRVSAMQQHTIEGMATLIESRDGSTGAHVRHTGEYAAMIAQEMYNRRMYPKEITSEFIDIMGRMAPLHDVGKIKISDAILNKPGKFTPEEYEIMKTHAPLGGEIIERILDRGLEPEMLQIARDIATYHHERWDGTGYPEGRKGTEIPLCARIMAAADVFDALSSERVYKPPMDIEDVFREMIKNENKQFQKEIVEVVISLRPQLEACLERNRKEAILQKTRRA